MRVKSRYPESFFFEPLGLVDGGLAAMQTRTLNYHMAATNLDCLILDVSVLQRNVKTASKTPKIVRSGPFHTLVMLWSLSAIFAQ